MAFKCTFMCWICGWIAVKGTCNLLLIKILISDIFNFVFKSDHISFIFNKFACLFSFDK